MACQISPQHRWSPVNTARSGVLKALHLAPKTRSPSAPSPCLPASAMPVPMPCKCAFARVWSNSGSKTPKAFHTGKPMTCTSKLKPLAALTPAPIIGLELLLRPTERRALPVIQRSERVALSTTHGAPERVCKSIRCLGVRRDCRSPIERDRIKLWRSDRPFPANRPGS